MKESIDTSPIIKVDKTSQWQIQFSVTFSAILIEVLDTCTGNIYKGSFSLTNNWDVQTSQQLLSSCGPITVSLESPNLKIIVPNFPVRFIVEPTAQDDITKQVTLLRIRLTTLESKTSTTQPQQLMNNLHLDCCRLHLSCYNKDSVTTTQWRDISGHGNHFTIPSGVTLSIKNGWDNSQTPSDCAGYIPSNKSISQPRCFTVEAWVEVAPDHAVKEMKGNGGMILSLVGEYYLEIKKNQTISVFCYGVTPTGYHDSVAVVQLNTKTHIAYTYDQEAHRIYINGKVDKEIKANGSSTKNGTGLYLGSNTSNSYRFYGKIFVARYYKRALTEGELRDHYEIEKKILD